MWISVLRPNILRMWNGKITHRSLVLFKTLKEPNTYQSAHNTVWVISDRERSAARQTNPSSFVSAACKKLKLIISNWKTAFIRKCVYIYIPQPPHCPLPSVSLLEDIDEIQVSKLSKDALLLTTERRFGSHNSNACPCLWYLATALSHAIFSSCFAVVKRSMILCGEGRGWDQERNHPIQGAGLQTSDFSIGVDEVDGGKETICSFIGQKEMHCPVSVKDLVLLQKKGGIQSIWRKGKKLTIVDPCHQPLLYPEAPALWQSTFLNCRPLWGLV